MNERLNLCSHVSRVGASVPDTSWSDSVIDRQPSWCVHNAETLNMHHSLMLKYPNSSWKILMWDVSAFALQLTANIFSPYCSIVWTVSTMKLKYFFHHVNHLHQGWLGLVSPHTFYWLVWLWAHCNTAKSFFHLWRMYITYEASYTHVLFHDRIPTFIHSCFT